MVGESAGIKIWSDMVFSHSSTSVQSSDGSGSGALLPIGRALTDLFNLFIDGLESLFRELAAIEDELADTLDWVVMLAHILDSSLVRYLPGSDHGMSTVAIGHHFQDHRALATAAQLNGLQCRRRPPARSCRRLFQTDIIIALAALGEIARRMALLTGAHAVFNCSQ